MGKNLFLRYFILSFLSLKNVFPYSWTRTQKQSEQQIDEKGLQFSAVYNTVSEPLLILGALLNRTEYTLKHNHTKAVHVRFSRLINTVSAKSDVYSFGMAMLKSIFRYRAENYQSHRGVAVVFSAL